MQLANSSHELYCVKISYYISYQITHKNFVMWYIKIMYKITTSGLQQHKTSLQQAYWIVPECSKLTLCMGTARMWGTTPHCVISPRIKISCYLFQREHVHQTSHKNHLFWKMNIDSCISAHHTPLQAQATYKRHQKRMCIKHNNQI